MKLIDLLSLYDSVDFDVPDDKIDAVITICYEKNEKEDKDFPYMQKFTKLLYESVEIDKMRSDGVPICKFSDIIEKNIPLFEQFIVDEWRSELQYLVCADRTFIDNGEFQYEFLKEFDAVVGGRYGETMNKKYYKLLQSAVQS